MRIMYVVGARPNFPKAAPLIAAIKDLDHSVDQVLVHTGQHYDFNMSKVFFGDLSLPEPDVHLNIDNGTHAEQTARIMLAFEPIAQQYQPDWTVVVGDVNSTLAAALVCAKLGLRVAHVEAGLRSFDRTMPEEVNRILTDQISDLLFTPSRDGNVNLLREGVAEEKIHFVGNVMIDTLVKMLPQAAQRPILNTMGLTAGNYVLVTLHRPFNVDQLETLLEILRALEAISQHWPVVFPVHPRTRKNIATLGELNLGKAVILLEPLGYLDFLALTRSARLVITDSGGIQEETTFLGVPCLTARPNTERPVTITQGTNRLVESTCAAILAAEQEVGTTALKPILPPELWDGQASLRIAKILMI